MATGGAVDVAAEEVVDGDVPFAGELEPVAGIPPSSGLECESNWERK
jgi:hypothetical protein